MFELSKIWKWGSHPGPTGWPIGRLDKMVLKGPGRRVWQQAITRPTADEGPSTREVTVL